MRPYELVILLHPDLEIDVDTPISKIEQLVETAGGKVTKRDNWGKKRLAYKIKQHEFAVYVYFELQMEPTKVQSLESSLLLTEEVIRHLVVAVEEPKSKPNKKKAKKAVAAGATGAAAEENDQADKEEGGK